MVCISCIVIPVFIWVWYRFIQPILSTIKLYFYPSIENPKPETEKLLDDKTVPSATEVSSNELKKDL